MEQEKRIIPRFNKNAKYHIGIKTSKAPNAKSPRFDPDKPQVIRFGYEFIDEGYGTFSDYLKENPDNFPEGMIFYCFEVSNADGREEFKLFDYGKTEKSDEPQPEHSASPPPETQEKQTVQTVVEQPPTPQIPQLYRSDHTVDITSLIREITNMLRPGDDAPDATGLIRDTLNEALGNQQRMYETQIAGMKDAYEKIIASKDQQIDMVNAQLTALGNTGAHTYLSDIIDKMDREKSELRNEMRDMENRYDTKIDAYIAEINDLKASLAEQEAQNDYLEKLQADKDNHEEQYRKTLEGLEDDKLALQRMQLENESRRMNGFMELGRSLLTSPLMNVLAKFVQDRMSPQQSAPKQENPAAESMPEPTPQVMPKQKINRETWDAYRQMIKDQHKDLTDTMIDQVMLSNYELNEGEPVTGSKEPDES